MKEQLAIHIKPLYRTTAMFPLEALASFLLAPWIPNYTFDKLDTVIRLQYEHQTLAKLKNSLQIYKNILVEP